MCVGEIIRAGGGIGLLPNFIVDNDNMLVDIPSDNTLPQWNLWLLHHPYLKNNSLVKTFTAYLKDAWV